MRSEYAAWIQQYEQSRVSIISIQLVGGVAGMSEEEILMWAVKNQCADATKAMVQAFPELTRVRGHYDYLEHWWCVAPDGTIVDPTARQLPLGGAYKEYTGPDPVGKCMNCGDYVWDRTFTSAACSQDCFDELQSEYTAYERS